MGEPAPAAGLDIRRFLLLGAVIAVILTAALFFFFRGCVPATRDRSGGYTVIYTNMALKDAANAIARLKELAIPYEIRDNGSAVAVPKDKADQARLGLAEKNLPAGGVVGWEIFDESKLGATDFDRRIQLIRAISGELSRTIRRIQGVEDAHVQIVMPETRLFAETTAPVTASVMLRIRPGFDLTAEKVNGIIHLVASSVENLQTVNVTVVDSTGRILTAKAPALPPIPELIPSVEAEMLPAPAPALIPMPPQPPTAETVIVKAQPTKEVVKAEKQQAKEKVVSAEVVATAVATTPAKAVTPEEKMLFVLQAKKETELDLSGKAQEILNRFYPPNSAIIKVNLDLAIPKKGMKLSREQLNISRITAIVLIDNRVEMTKTLKAATYKAVAAAVGYNRNRGDKIVMQKVPFHLATPPPEIVRGEVEKNLPPKTAGLPALPLKSLLNGALWLAVSALILAVIFFVVKIVRRRPETVPAADITAAQPPISREKLSALDNVRSAVERNPEKIAELLRSWLTE
ncbi:MAG: flagellar basal-body MS-ring/collar protein FliF [Candidatus Margulisbacteria bacterium]|nr:flagellar basal-body MS-ring/collar protein FliF [Candidatus Margulisiibacteriota bacterium]